MFVDSGLGNALIQKKDADDIDFSSVFYFNIILCISIYGLLFLLSPVIAKFYNNEQLTKILRVAGLLIVISGIKNVQQAYVSKHLLFKKFFFATLGGTLGAAVIGVTMAYLGYGVWALVAQMLFNAAVDTIILWLTVKWRPIKAFSLVRLKGLLSYGWKLLVSSLIATLYNDLRQLIIGKMYSSSDLAFYNKGRQLPYLATENINNSIDSVLLPTMSAEQDKRDHVKRMTQRAIKTSSYIMWPLMIGLAACSTPLIRLMYTEKWLFCVPYLRVFCITYAFYPIHTANLNAIKALGRSDTYLKLEILKKILGLVILFVSIRFGVMAMAYSTLITSITGQIINSWPNKKLLGYQYYEQLKDIIPSILLSLFMGFAIYWISLIDMPDIFIVLVQVASGIAVYTIGSIIFKVESFSYILHIVKTKIKV